MLLPLFKGQSQHLGKYLRLGGAQYMSTAELIKG